MFVNINRPSSTTVHKSSKASLFLCYLQDSYFQIRCLVFYTVYHYGNDEKVVDGRCVVMLALWQTLAVFGTSPIWKDGVWILIWCIVRRKVLTC